MADAPAPPPGMSPLSPHLVCADAAAEIAFLVKAFGATEMVRLPDDRGRIMHASVSLNGGSVMLADEGLGGSESRGPKALGGTPVTLHMILADADAAAASAVAAGGTAIMPVADMFWGDRYGIVASPNGHLYALATPMRQVNPEDLGALAKEAMGG